MGTVDRPSSQPDVPNEVAAALAGQVGRSSDGPNLDRQTNEAAAAFLGLDRQDRRLPDLIGGGESPAEAGVRGGLPRWKPTHPTELPELVVRRDVGPGIKPPDYRNPDAKDTLKLEHGQEVIVGKKGSLEDPRRIAEVRHDRIIDKQTDEPPPEEPSGEELMEPNGEGRSKYDKIADAAGKPETLDNLESAAKEVTRLVNEWMDRPKPTGSYTGTPGMPAVYDQQSQGVEGALVVAPVVLWLMAHHGIRSGLDRFNEWKQSRGNQADAGD